MHHAALVRVGQRRCDLVGEPDRFLHRKPGFAVQPVAKRLALHVGHDVVEEPVGFPRVEERQDMGVGKLGRDLDFPDKPLGAQCCGEFRPKDLDRYLAAVLSVLSEVDGRHPAAAELALEKVSVGDGRCEAF